MTASLPVLFASLYLSEEAASPDPPLSSLFHSRPLAASLSPGNENSSGEMREGEFKNWSTAQASLPVLLPPTFYTHCASSIRNGIYPAAWCSKRMTQLLVLILTRLHVAQELTGNLHPHPPPSFLTPESRVCYEIPRVMSGLPTTFPCEEGLCRAAWDMKATAQKEWANTRTILRLFHAQYFPVFSTLLLSRTTCEMQTWVDF